MGAGALAGVLVRRLLMLGALAGLLAACSSAPYGGYGHGVTPHPVYKVGAPYQIKGVWYHPHVDYRYDEVGTASWYGEQFEGRLTANGEIFELNQLTAAHKTLPMPSIVEVTNLQTGRALRLRVNDRGPFVDGRIIDLSRRAAQLLGFERNGTARVRVRILREESIRAAAELMHGNFGAGEEPAMVAAVPHSVTSTPLITTR
jgi:rare lipoprotein A